MRSTAPPSQMSQSASALLLRRLLSAGAALTLGALVWRAVALHCNPPLGRMLALDGGPVHVIEGGNPHGPAVLLIHGSDGVAQDWPTSPLWQQLAPHFRLIAPDRLGHGYTPARADISVAANAQALAEVLDALEVKGVTVLGHSYGAPVGVVLTQLLKPGRVNGLVLVSPVSYDAPGLTHPLAQLLDVQLLGQRPVEWLVTRVLLVPIGLATVELEGRRAFHPSPMPPAWRRTMQAFSLRRSQVLALAKENRTIADELLPLQKGYSRLALPVIILTGHQDAMTPREHHAARSAQALTQAQLWSLEGGHQLHWTHPQEVAAAVQQVAGVQGTAS